jgi:hypothetical protein
LVLYAYMCVFAHSRSVENPPTWSWETNPSFLRWFCHTDDNLLAPLFLTNVCGKIMWTLHMHKWRVPLKIFFSTVKQTTVTVQNHANMSIWTKYLLSHKAKKQWPVLVVLTLDHCKCKRQELIFCSHANSNHQCTFVLSSQKSVINTNYRSTLCEVGHTLWEAPEGMLQHRIVSTCFIGKPLTTSIDDASGD